MLPPSGPLTWREQTVVLPPAIERAPQAGRYFLAALFHRHCEHVRGPGMFERNTIHFRSGVKVTFGSSL